MTVVDNRTTNQDYPLPYGDNDLSDDVLRLIAAINAIDVDMATTFASLAGKAATVHGHAISDVSGLQTALDAKLDGASGITISQVTNLQTTLDAKAPIASPQFTGTPSSTNPAGSENSTRIATTQWVKSLGYLLANQTITFTGAISGSGTTSISTSLADGAVSEAKLGTGAVTEAKIGTGAVTEAKIGTGAVTVDKIGTGAVSFAKFASAALASAAEFISNTASKVLTVSGIWTAAAPVAITDASSVTPNMSSFINATITKSVNGTLENPTNPKPGQAGFIVFTQDTAGDKTQSFGSNWKNIGVRTSLQTGNAKKTRLDYSVVSTSEIHYSLSWVP